MLDFFTKTSYNLQYNSYDLNYKLKLKSIYSKPKITKIAVHLNPQSLLNMLNIDEHLKQKILLKCWILLYFLNFTIPTINSFYLKDTDSRSVRQPVNFYSFMISKRNRIDLLQLLMFFLIEHDSIESTSLSHKFLDKNIITENQINYQLLINIKRLTSLTELLEGLFNKVELQSVNLELNLVINTGSKNTLKRKMIKSIFPLWNL
jgi:hypothetical protein